MGNILTDITVRTLMTTTGIATDENTTTESKEKVDYANPWTYLDKPFTSDDIGDNYGFVYLIVNTVTTESISEESISGRNEP